MKNPDTVACYIEQVLLQIEGTNVLRPGIRDTPARVAKAYEEMFSGYHEDPEKILLERTFGEDDVFLQTYQNMIIQRDIPFYSFCEHHMLPFFGTADVGYVSDEEVCGLSKLARLVDCYAKRLQVQERMTHQIATTLQEVLQPKGVMVVVKAEHLCMCARGVRKPGSQTITSSITGVFLDNPSAKQEFLFLTDTQR